MKRLKIIHFIHGLSTGGAETLVKDYLLNFDKFNFDVVLVCLFHEVDSPYEEILVKNRIRVIYVEDLFSVKRRKNIVSRAINKCNRFFIVRKIIKKESPDILHTHLTLNSMVKFARPRKEAIIFHTVHNEPRVLWSRDKKGRQKDFNAAKWLVKNHDMRFIVLHDKMRKEVNKLFEVSNTVVLNNGIELSKFGNMKDKKRIRSALNIPLDAFVVGHVGRFSEQKNHDFLVDVFLRVKSENKKAFLLMIGDGVDKKKIIDKLEKVGMGGNYLILSNRGDVADLMSVMDVFVFPSKYEGLGIVLIEAQETKLPCFVSSNVPEHATISNLVTRLSLKDGPSKWADTVLNYEKPSKIIVNDADWDIKKATKRLEKIYLDALKEKQDGGK